MLILSLYRGQILSNMLDPPPVVNDMSLIIAPSGDCIKGNDELFGGGKIYSMLFWGELGIWYQRKEAHHEKIFFFLFFQWKLGSFLAQKYYR